MWGIVLDFQESQTYINLQISLLNLLEESTLLDLYEAQANEEVLIPISLLFSTNARHSRFIANRIHGTIYGETITLDNLIAAREREDRELNLYLEYSEQALEEGYDEFASLFNGISNILRNHLFAYEAAIDDIISNQLFCKPEETLWICIGCGNIISGLCAPEVCPVCLTPQGFYQQLTTYE